MAKTTKEKIISIEDTIFKIDEWSSYEGWVITTDLQTIKFGIQNEQDCCENFGHIMTNDDVKEFIGETLEGIAVVDEALDNKKLPEIESLDEGSAMFVNFETSAGTLQFVCYNSHNGYYGHGAVLISRQLNASQTL